MLERAFMPAALFRGLLVLGSLYRAGGRSIRHSRTWLILFGRLLFTFFCSLVSYSYASSLDCAREEQLFCKDRFGWSTWFVFSCFIPIWVVTGSGFMSPYDGASTFSTCLSRKTVIRQSISINKMFRGRCDTLYFPSPRPPRRVRSTR